MKRQVEAVANQLNNASIIENVLSLRKMANGSTVWKSENFASFEKFRENNPEGNH